MQFLTFFAIMAIVTVGPWFERTAQAQAIGQITIQTQAGPVQITAEYAITSQQRARGLMGRTSLPERHGMLFIYEKPQPITMWMKDTPLSLDMFFINRRGIIRRIEEKTEPNSTRKIHSAGKAIAVLELAGGSAKRLGIKAGDQVILP